ncbi:hypothetical protein K9325_004933 [Salmonella enterica subsp. enterica serovar Kinondoni]|nr:hypothetical protein [Salmonella enterica subsp. enterica serovar Kinondoni]
MKEKVRVTVSVDKDIHQALKILSKASSKSISALIAGFIPDEKAINALVENKSMFKAIPEELINEAMYEVMSDLMSKINELSDNPLCEFQVKRKEKKA